MYIEKIKVMNMVSKRKKNDDIILELKDDLNLLKQYKFYLPDFLFSLWEKPNIMAFILQNADKSDIKNYLAPFIVNNFYENILSLNFIEENLIYVLTILLNNEINNLSSIKENVNFLNDSHCGYLLEQLRRKKDIQTFFKNAIIDSIEDLETNFSKNKLNFNIKDIYENCLEENTNKSKFDDKDKYYQSKKFKIEQANFNKKYMSLLNKNSLDTFIEGKNFDNNNKILYNSYKSKLENLSEDKLLYSNQQFLLNINKYDISSDILLKYQKNFIRVTKFINLILDNILKNLHSLPYSIRIFCKIISLIVLKKFPKINELEKTIFLAKFFFGKLLIPILRNPGIEAYINSIILSENTINNIQIICDIINKFVTGELYSSDNNKTCDYTPFNWYFIEKSEQIYKILTTKVKLPTFIQNFINNNLSPNFEYDYFQQNKNEVINYRSICFNIHEINALIKTIDKNKSEILKFPGTDVLSKTLNKLISKNYKKLIDDITEKELNSEIKNKSEINKEGNISKEKQTIFYFLITSLIANNEYKKLFEISQPSKSFTIKEMNDLSNENDIKQNNIIKVKNFICSLLYNFDKLVESNFEIDSIENTEKIFQHLNILMNSPYFVINNDIPFDWYINSIFEYLQKIPENLTKNDCEELYKEIETDIKNSLSQLDFIKLSVILEKLDFAERGKIFYKENQKLLVDIGLKEKAKLIAQKEFIPVIIKFNWNEGNNNGLFLIESCNFEEKDKNNIKKIKDFEHSKQAMLALTIDMFIEKFPDLIRYEEYQDMDIFMIQEKLNFAENLSKYFDIVFKYVQMKKNFRKNGQNMIRLRKNIFDYVMIKLYDKIFPAGSSERDNLLFQQCVCLSWVRPKHFLGNKKQYVFGSYLEDLKRNFKLLHSEKSTRKKIKNMNKIFNDISFFYEFNGIKDIGVDDIIPILAYGIIKAQPFFLVSNIKFIKLYHNLCNFFSEGNIYEQLNAVMELIININYTNLKGITKDEFVKNMKIPKN